MIRSVLHAILRKIPLIDVFVCGRLRALWLRFRYLRNQLAITWKVRSGRRVRIIFLVSETTKWKAQAVYDRLRENTRYELLVVASLGDADWALSKEQKLHKVMDTLDYFKEHGMPCEASVDGETAETQSLAGFHPDLVFYQQPWGLPVNQTPRLVSEYALTFYVPYFVPTFANNTMHCQLQLHKDVFRHFVLNEKWKEFYLATIHSAVYAGEIVAVGHPILDVISRNDEACMNSESVIYAPHWSINHPNNPNELNLSTFPETGLFILKYAQSHPEIKWVFKPHPTLRLALHRIGLMSDSEIDAYYTAWECFARVSYSGEYASLFQASRALITDCDSFLSEYACTKKPIVHLMPKVSNNRHFSPMKNLYDTYYQVRDQETLVKILDSVVLHHEDPKQAERLAALAETGLSESTAAEKICTHIESLLGM